MAGWPSWALFSSMQREPFRSDASEASPQPVTISPQPQRLQRQRRPTQASPFFLLSCNTITITPTQLPPLSQSSHSRTGSWRYRDHPSAHPRTLHATFRIRARDKPRALRCWNLRLYPTGRVERGGYSGLQTTDEVRRYLSHICVRYVKHSRFLKFISKS